MPKLNQRGIANIFSLAILIIGLVAGVYLVQHTQIFKPKAYENSNENNLVTQIPLTLNNFYQEEEKITAIGDEMFRSYDVSQNKIRQLSNTSEISSEELYTVQPYLVYPADKSIYPEYESAVNLFLIELQKYYKDNLGVTFKLTPLRVIKSRFDYINMRCGVNPEQKCIDDPSVIKEQWMWIQGLHSATSPEERVIKLVFGVGGGGFAGGPRNYAMVGDWVLEPLSGKPNEWGIPCSYSNGWQCVLNTAKGTVAHELGHSLGIIDHPPAEKDSIMNKHWEYPIVGFLDYETEILKMLPYLK